ncbi:hypothetical protein LHJ74_22065 [Streptomyces sp. N2-109]|uniref:Uncharacterized protein n=1 Tax=Streptomyces gossypii TaxID=2883101 RepID=A0ABT2JXD6_9ACTN|nr:hypothetical protein [Streptomyces gossypii]MCT2592560.1 hypothetical protein [Streptomyces gossypii]
MNSMRYRAAGVLTTVVLATSGGIGAQAGWGHTAVKGHHAAGQVLGSGEGPAVVVTPPGSGEGPAVAN